MKTRDAIVRAARRLFYERGFEKTSLADLAQQAGVPKGNFYYHFKSKDDVLRAVLEARLEDVSAALERWAEGLPGPRARLTRFVEMMASERDDLASFGCPMGSMITELGKKREDLQPDARALMDRYVAFCTEQLEALDVDGDPRELALRLMARCQGAVLVAHAYHDPALLDREIADVQRWVAAL